MPLDPQLVTLDLDAPATRFSDQPGSLLKDGGWARTGVEIEPRTGREYFIASVQGTEAAMRFELVEPRHAEFDFYASCKPVGSDRNGPQHMAVEIGGIELGTVAMKDGWQTIRLAIPRAGLRTGTNRIRLEFAHATSPFELGLGSDRLRRAATFRTIAIVPRDVADPEQYLERARLASSKSRIELSANASAVFPVPAKSRMTLRLEAVARDCSDCRLVASVNGADGARSEIRDWRLDGVLDATSTFETSPAMGMLELRLLASPAAVRAGRHPRVGFDLSKDFLTLSRRQQASPSTPHVFLYLIDTLRADADVPRIEAFADDAVTYRNAWAASTWTLPSVVSILTGLYPDRHGILTGEERPAEGDVPSLPAALVALGYQTAAFSQSSVAGPQFGIDSGFETFLTSNELGGDLLRSQEVRHHFLQWIATRRDPALPLFAYLHTVDPHAPYRPSGRLRSSVDDERQMPLSFMLEGYGRDPEQVARLRSLYDAEVDHADVQFVRFLEMLRYLGMYDDSLIVVVSDHGEEFGEHEGFDHGRTIYEELLRVPLVIKYPHSAWAGSFVDDRVSLVDLAPTILEVAGSGPPRLDGDGMSLDPPAVEARRSDAPRVVRAEVETDGVFDLYPVHYRAYGVGRYKCIESLRETDQLGRTIPRWRRFDLAVDPQELDPVDHGSLAEDWCRRAVVRSERDRPSGQAATTPAEASSLETLQSLGYVR
jgi:arylsulfatase A-like enzyme